MLIILIFFASISTILNEETCGPLGYPAKVLLSPSYWYFDLPHSKCPPKPADHFTPKSNSSSCRIYFNVCRKLAYQCSGTVCARYMEKGWDLVALLGQYNYYPFTEWKLRDDFSADYVGERLMCKLGEINIKTKFYFHCHVNATWPIKISAAHGGVRAPTPQVDFDPIQCQITFNFNYSGACWTPSKHDSFVTPISGGSWALILVIPGVILYFLMAVLFNCHRGIKGKDLIPHREFVSDLPELILDGMMFTFAVISCRKEEERYHSEYEPVEPLQS